MIIRKLELTNFRSYPSLVVEFQNKMNVILGNNGAGKTNVVEAIHYLSLARSFRTTDDKALITKGQSFAKIIAFIEEDTLTREVEINLTPVGKKIMINRKQIQKLSQLSTIMNVIVFEPKDVMIFDDTPKVRRKFLDISLTKHSAHYFDDLTRYEHLLKERNDLLKSLNIDKTHLSILTKQLVEASYPLVEARTKYLEMINQVIGKIVTTIKGEAFKLQLKYAPFIEVKKNFNEEALKLFEQNLESDLKRKVTQIGVHREDFVIIYEERAIASFGSQGENRLAALALKLSPYFLIEDKDLRPVIVLDDVLSELDHETQHRLLQFLEKMQQVFVTSTQYPKPIDDAYIVENNQISRRKH
jgi:DNA replication and repair protein RecF